MFTKKNYWDIFINPDAFNHFARLNNESEKRFELFEI